MAGSSVAAEDGAPPLDGAAKLPEPCGVPGCDYETTSPLAMGAHRKRKHGIAGKTSAGKTGGTKRATPSGSGKRTPAAPSGGGEPVALSQIADALHKLGTGWDSSTGDAIDGQADELAGALVDFAKWKFPSVEKVAGLDMGKEGMAEKVALAKAGAPVLGAFVGEYLMPRVARFIRGMFTKRQTLQPLTDEQGQPQHGPDGHPLVFHPQTGVVYLHDGKTRVGTLQDGPDRPEGPEAPPSSPVEAPEPPPAPMGPEAGPAAPAAPEGASLLPVPMGGA